MTMTREAVSRREANGNGAHAAPRTTGGEPSLGQELAQAALLLRDAAETLARCVSRLAGSREEPSPQRASTESAPAAPAMGDRLTTKQVGAIFGIARRQGLSRDQIIALVRDRTGKHRVEHLTRHEASDLIGELDQRNGAHP